MADLDEREVARFVRRFLAHRQFDTTAKRLGKIVRLRPESLSVFTAHNEKAQRVAWAIV